MKIAYMSNSIIPSRTANSVHVMKMCQAFRLKGHNVTLFANGNTTNENIFDFYGINTEFSLIKIKRPNIKGVGSFFYAQNVYKYIRNKDLPDVFYGRDIYSLIRIIKFNKPIIYEVHSIPNTIFHEIIEKILFKQKNFRRLVVISKSLKDAYIKKYKQLKDKDIVVAPDGADLPKKNYSKIDKNKKNLDVGYVGHLYSGRGIDIIIELASRFENLNFHIIGGMDKDITYWKKQCIHNKNIKFYGFIPNGNLPQYYKNFDIVLAPYQEKVQVAGDKGDTSRWMSPMKIFEYMSFSKALIASDLPVLREILENKNNCLLCSPHNVDSWESALFELLDNEELRISIGQNAYNALKKRYTWNRRVDIVLTDIIT